MNALLRFINRSRCAIYLMVMAALAIPAPAAAQAGATGLPARIPPRRSSQIYIGLGGVNASLPRPPYLPWNRWWWTRTFDAGFKYVRIGQYEDSSDQTSWDWVERKRGHFAISPRVDQFVNSLVDNGTTIELQLLYGNPLYTSPAGILPDSIIPAQVTVHNPDHGLYSIFWAPRTQPQIDAFIRYTQWMVNHFRGRIHYYSLWNEENGGYWVPKNRPKQYGRLLKAFIPAVHQTDPKAKIVFGGLSNVGTEFPKAALEACQCASGIDVFAYHTYPGNRPPESVDSGAFKTDSPKKLREMVRSFPGTRPDIKFWDDEYSQSFVQAKYFPRMLVYNWASHIPTYIWELINDTSSGEGDEYGIIHGMMYKADDFKPRPVFGPLQNTNAVFADTRRDRSVKISISNQGEMERSAGGPFFAYAFRSSEGKVIVAYWLGAKSQPGEHFTPRYTTMTLGKTGIRHPVLANIVSGKISRLEWARGGANTLKKLPVLDSVLVVADASYFDWPVLPAAPSSLHAAASGRSVRLTWAVHGNESKQIAVEREEGNSGRWETIATLAANATGYVDTKPAKGIASYRVRARNGSGESAYSNIVNVGGSQ